ncbi:hypothetical protein CV133_gene45 [Chlorobiaceae phage CV-1-33]|nr:hypothetical protein [Chlorobiaceae bacterium]QOE32052.1 hypothetical protein CV133_gene45 [Chlorobiaceae phage CV-1-33]
MALVPITPTPGVVKVGTDYSNKGQWIDSNLVRWINSRAHPIGGWTVLFNGTISGQIIGLYSYPIGELPVLIIGTTSNVYRYDGTLTDITPSGFTPPTTGTLTAVGYGTGMYGTGNYGSARTTPSALFSPTAYAYAFSSFGTTLVMSCTSDGNIYILPSGASILTTCPNAPNGVSWSITSDERFLFAICPLGNKGKIQWSDREDYTNWNVTATTLSGSLSIPGEDDINNAVNWNGNIYIFSSSAVYRVNFVGGTLVYGIKTIVNKYDSPLSNRSVVCTPNFLCWLSKTGIGTWNGQYMQIDNPVNGFISNNIYPGYESYTFGGYQEKYNEVWWFFSSTASIIPNKYVVWSITDNLWSIGSLTRGAWNTSSVFDNAILSDDAGVIYEHENGSLSGSSGIGSLIPYLQSAPNEISEGDNVMMVDRLIPDELTVGADILTYTIKYSMYPTAPMQSTPSYQVSNGKIDLRVTARQMAIRVDGVTDADFSIGVLRANVVQRGSR